MSDKIIKKDTSKIVLLIFCLTAHQVTKYWNT